MDGLYSIGELAQRTGLTVKAIRFYADEGIVPPTTRSPAGYRLFDIDALARLELVRTLRELGLDLATVRKVVTREVSLPDVAATHAAALEAQIRTLRLRRAVLTAVARRGSGPEETALMHKLAALTADERNRLIGEFLDAALPETWEGPRRTMTPELPDDPTPEQVDAWVELAELAMDPGFRESMRRMADHFTPSLKKDPVAEVRDLVAPAMAAGLSPSDVEYGEQIRPHVERLRAANDPRRDRYMRLLAIVNGWPPPQDLAPVLDWALESVSASS
ncbi:MerR family transcriptional regulator [Nonomuraea sp. NPDC050556]|uniref:MerR family transcriptional regulator n=1 Tax=Nonomuraea sp. NPDC050556 TaxID=3364369 RepID=UPI00379B341A